MKSDADLIKNIENAARMYGSAVEALRQAITAAEAAGLDVLPNDFEVPERDIRVTRERRIKFAEGAGATAD